MIWYGERWDKLQVLASSLEVLKGLWDGLKLDMRSQRTSQIMELRRSL